MKLNRVILVMSILCLMAIFAACGGGDQTASGNNASNGADNTSNNSSNTTGDDSTGGDQVEATVISGDLILDPAKIPLDNIASLLISDHLYDTLVTLDANGAIGPGLALTAEEADDGLTYVFTLRTDAVFSDGTPVTADVILANYNRWFDPENPLHGEDADYEAWVEYFKGFRGELDADGHPVSLFDGIEKADELTVLIHLNEPMADFLSIIATPFFSILNPTTIEAGDYGTSMDTVDGTGPYLISAWDNAGLTLSPNPNFWGELPSGDLTFIFE